MKDILEILSEIKSAKVISSAIDYKNYVPLDLSVTNENLIHQNLATAKDYENYIQHYLDHHQKKIAFGGYLETRNL